MMTPEPRLACPLRAALPPPRRLSPLLGALALATAACAGACIGDDDPALLPAPDAPLIEPDAAPCAVAPITFSHQPGAAAPARVHKLSLAEHPLAQCNDGTPAYYVFRPGFGGGARRWHVYLEGGGSCENAAECAQRWRSTPALMTSRDVADGDVIREPYRGIKSADPLENPDLYDANLVQIHYCSSDQWSGDAPAAAGAPIDEMEHWHFRGRAIVAAVLEDLAAQGLASAREVLLSGSSAGGMGVASLADDVRARLPPSLRVVALQDAGFGLLYPPYDPVTKRESTQRPSPQELTYTAATRSWGGRGDATCDARARDDGERAACHIPSQTFPPADVTTPMFVRQSQLDAVQTKRLIDPEDTSRPAVAYRERFGATMRQTLAGLPAHFGVFSGHDAEHVIMTTTEGWTSRAVDGVVLRDAFGAWYRNPCAGVTKRIEP